MSRNIFFFGACACEPASATSCHWDGLTGWLLKASRCTSVLDDCPTALLWHSQQPVARCRTAAAGFTGQQDRRRRERRRRVSLGDFQPVAHITTKGPLIGCSLQFCCYCLDFSALGIVVERLHKIILDGPSFITRRIFWEHIKPMSAVKTRFISDMIQNCPQTKFIIHLFLWAWIENFCDDFPKITSRLIKASTDIYFVLSETFVLLV